MLLRAVVLNSEGHTSGELAKILQVPRSKVSEWLQRYQTEGVDGLLEGYRQQYSTKRFIAIEAGPGEVRNGIPRTAYIRGMAR